MLAAAACREDGTIIVASLKFEGVEQVDERALRRVLQTKQGSWIPWGRKYAFDRSAFQGDLRRIEVFYRDRGFPDARVESFDLALNEAQDEVRITVRIHEGEPVRIADVQMRGFDVLPEEARAQLRERLPLRAGDPLDRDLAAASRDLALNALRDAGYPYAQVSVVDEDLAPGLRRLVLEADPGTAARFGPIEIEGEVSVSEDVIRRQLTFEPGDLFTRQALRDSQRRLYAMELFQFVNVESFENVDDAAPEVPVRVTVVEGDPQRVRFGVGYGSEERARARIRWEHANFLGNARQLGVEGKWSSLDRGIRLEMREPYVLANGFSLALDGQAWQASEPVYSSNQLGGSAALRYEPTPRNRFAVSLIGQYQRSVVKPEALEPQTYLDIRDDLIALGLDPRDGVDEGTLSAVAFDVDRNTTDDLLDARRGYVFNAHIERAGTWLRGSYDYYLASFEGRYYLTVGRRFVVANRLHTGTIDPAADDPANVPFRKRFFLGGASSIRGWGRFEVSPLSGFGLPIGGFSMLIGSSEVRFPVWGRVGMVAFADYGNVWPDSWAFDLGDLRYAVGSGLRYRTPIGPLRLDLGYQLTPIQGLRIGDRDPSRQRRWRVHLSVGQAF